MVNTNRILTKGGVFFEKVTQYYVITYDVIFSCIFNNRIG